MGELCVRIDIGWTCCNICCEVNTGNKRILIQQKIETLDLFCKQFIWNEHQSFLKETEPKVYNMGAHPRAEVNKFDYDPKEANDKKASMKYLFLARFAKEGRTLEAAYNAWGTLTFGPSKDDIEQFVLKVEELAKKLGYNEDAQVMVVKSVLPRDVYGICMTYKNLKDLKTFLIELFSNPKMREAVSGSASAPSDPSVFSIGQHMENNVVSTTAADVRFAKT